MLQIDMYIYKFVKIQAKLQFKQFKIRQNIK